MHRAVGTCLGTVCMYLPGYQTGTCILWNRLPHASSTWLYLFSAVAVPFYQQCSEKYRLFVYTCKCIYIFSV